jgi:hypothetical protein
VKTGKKKSLVVQPPVWKSLDDLHQRRARMVKIQDKGEMVRCEEAS